MPRPRRLGRTFRRSALSSAIEPAVGSTNPAIICNVVVLPQPDGPSSATNSPRSTENDRRSTANSLSNRLVSRSRTRKAMRSRSAFDFPVPASGPLVTMPIDRIPIEIDELFGALAHRRYRYVLWVDLGVPVDRSVAVFFRQHDLQIGRQHRLDERLRRGRGIRFGHRTG